MIVAQHIANEKKILAVCDKELIGEILTDGELSLNLSSTFYKGEETKFEKLDSICKGALSIDFVGENSVAAGIKLGLIKEENVIKIGEVPRCQMYYMEDS